jgi:acetyl-CoA acyltransferase
MGRNVVIAGAVRTPVGRRKGVFRNIHPVDLAAEPLREVVNRVGIDNHMVEDVVMGCVTPFAEQGFNIGRLAALRAGFPIEVPGIQINRMCGSGQQAIHFAAQAIAAGDMDITIAAGVESMTRVPMGTDGSYEISVSPALQKQFEWIHQGLSAERIAQKWGISRTELDEFSLESHHRALQAIENGKFTSEIVPVKGHDKNDQSILVSIDEGPRPDTSMEALGNLKPVFQEGGVITAGNASQISDGAAAVLLMTEELAERMGIQPFARIVARVVVGSDPTLMLDGIIPATRKVLARTGLKIDDIDVFEVNEAFASVVLAWKRELNPDMRKVNAYGGAIALGHPLGASGAKLMTTLVHRLRESGGRYGLQTMCIGHGMAVATIIEAIH